MDDTNRFSINQTAGTASCWKSSAILLIFLSMGALFSTTAKAQFVDTFDRPDSPTIGNGWLQKAPEVFDLSNGSVRKLALSSGYLDNVVYRPASEDALDVEASIEFRLLNPSPGYPQLFTRIQQTTVGNPATLDGYIMYINDDPSLAVVGRQRGSSFLSELALMAITPALNTTDTYRMRLQTIGSSPVQISAYVERLNGSAWETIAQANFSDNATAQISTPGAVGFGGYIEDGYLYDNFVRNTFGAGNNPLPVLTSINPGTATEGGSAFSLSLFGTNFLPGTVVRWNGADRATTYVSATELQATITAADIAIAGSASVTAFSPAPGGGTSAAQTFTIDPPVASNPLPVLSSVNPSSVIEGGSAFSLSLFGSNFVPGTVVRWNGADRATTYVSASELQATITTADIATAGSASVTAFSPAPGGGTSAAQTFTIDPPVAGNPLPILTSVNPSAATEGGSAFALSLFGNSFLPGTVVRWNGADRATTYVSASELQATITAADIATAGSASVTAFSPAPGGGTSAAQTFAIDPPVVGNPLPVLTSINPGSATEGGSTFSLSLFGSNFLPGTVVRWNGADRATTYVSAGELQATITAADIATAGSASVTAFSPAPGGGTSAAQAFAIQNATPGGNYDFLDDFNRPDSATLGNGWLEKAPQAFDLTSGSVRKLASSSGYLNNIVYRPASEDALDVEASIEFQLQNPLPGYPQLFTRVQQATVGTAGTLDGYILFVNDDATIAFVGQQVGSGFLTELASMNISPALTTSDTYRMRLRTTGTSPVQINAYIERLAGSIWQVIAQLSFADASPARITSLGSVGFGGYIEDGYLYDNFTRTTLDSGSNPLPVLSSVSPNIVNEGGSAFLLSVSGADFTPGSVVRWNGFDRATTYTSSNELQATITSADIAVTGSASVTVFSPAPGGGTSIAATVTINPPVAGNAIPVLNSINPNSATEGGSAFALSIQGSDFVPGTVVRWNGVDRATTYISATQLQATITSADIANTGTALVAVFSPTPGGGTSGFQTFTINSIVVNNPVPIVASISPNTVFAGGSAFSMTVNGSNFVPGTVVRWNGTDRTTTYVSSNELRAAITSIDIAAAGSASVTAFSPAPGGGISAVQSFAISINPGAGTEPTIVDLMPESTIAGTGGLTLAILGSNFTAQSTALWNGSVRAATFISPQQLDIAVSATDVASSQTATIIVRDQNGVISRPYPFLVVDPNNSYFFDNFNSADSESIGNQWTEKNPSAFSIQDNQVTGIDTIGSVYRDNIVYRPAAEDLRDVELSFEFVRQDSMGFAQLHARTQRNTIATPDLLESYILYVEDFLGPNGGLSFAIGPDQVNTGECIIDILPFTNPLVIGERYRMTFRVTGTNPVQLDGSIDWFDGTAWQEHISGTVIHDDNSQPDPFYCDPGFMPPPLAAPGASGFSKWTNSPENYDNFYWRDISGSSGIPTTSTISPALVEEDGPGFSLLVTGAEFVPGSVVRWDGQDRPTTYISSTALQATIDSTDILTPSTVQVTVFTPPPGGGLSSPLSFEIYPFGQQVNPAPTLQSITPSIIIAGSGGFQLSVTGSGFTSASVVEWTGSARTTTFVSSTNLLATIPAADVSVNGSVAITVSNPTPGGGTSQPQSVTIIQGGEFFDDFNRANNGNLGNGWLEKSPGAFSINAQVLQKNAVSTSYLNVIAYRPPSEDVLDAETSVEIQIFDTAPGYPQVLTRVQSATVANLDFLDGYMMYLDDRTDRAEIGRQIGSDFVVTLTGVIFTESMQIGETYRMRLSASGTGSSVTITGIVERRVGTGFVEIGRATTIDSSPQRIQLPGVAAIGGYIGSAFQYDNFRSINLN